MSQMHTHLIYKKIRMQKNYIFKVIKLRNSLNCLIILVLFIFSTYKAVALTLNKNFFKTTTYLSSWQRKNLFTCNKQKEKTFLSLLL